MTTVKTAISIDENLDKKVKKLAEKLHMPKSQVFSQAVEYFIERDENLELLQKINDAHTVYSTKNDNENTDDLKKEKKLHKKIIEKW